MGLLPDQIQVRIRECEAASLPETYDIRASVNTTIGEYTGKDWDEIPRMRELAG